MTPEYHSTTTLNRIRASHPCQDGWTKLLAHLGKTAADDEPLSLLTILDSNGMADALWCLDADPALDRLKRHFQAWCAEQVVHLFEADQPGDTRVRDQIAMLRRDDASDAERAAESAAAKDAASDAAWDAARAAAWDAAWVAASPEAGAAAWVAARDAASPEASPEARAAARAAAKDAQEKQLRAMLEAKR